MRSEPFGMSGGHRGTRHVEAGGARLDGPETYAIGDTSRHDWSALIRSVRSLPASGSERLDAGSICGELGQDPIHMGLDGLARDDQSRGEPPVTRPWLQR